MSFSWAAVFLLLSTPLMAGLATAYQDDTHFYLENDVLKIAVLRSTGNLDGIIHKQSGVNLQSNTTNDYSASWVMSLTTATGTNLIVNDNQAISFNGTTSNTATGAALTLTWQGLQYLPNGLPNMPNITFSAQLSVRTDSELSYWTMQISGLGTNSVTQITFPTIQGIGPLGATGASSLAGYGGKKQIFALAQSYSGTPSNGGAFTDAGSWTPAASTPSVVSVNPINNTGLSEVFTVAYSDTGGANDLQSVYLSFGTAFLATNSCNVFYEPGNNSLFLLSDDNSSSATLGEGGGGSVSNSQCTLSGGSTAATESGDSLSVPFTITFKSGFTGTKSVFSLAQTYAGTQSGTPAGTPTTLGTWTP
jgi:hypothetical protein